MFRCDSCGHEFSESSPPGLCPRCGEWSRERCSECGHVASAQYCLHEKGCCPRCVARATAAQIADADTGWAIRLATLAGAFVAFWWFRSSIGAFATSILNGWFSARLDARSLGSYGTWGSWAL